MIIYIVSGGGRTSRAKEKITMTKTNSISSINLNHNESIDIASLPYGMTQHILVKLGQRRYYVDVQKNSRNACVDFYRYTDRGGKWGNLVVGAVFVKSDAFLRRSFFDNIIDIKRAQDVYREFERVLGVVEY